MPIYCQNEVLLMRICGYQLSCAAAPDGCIYCMPANADRILKVYPNNGDAMSSVGDVLVGGVNGFHKYIGTMVGID